MLTGVVSFFGSVNVAMSMLMDLMRVPADLFQLYLAINVVTGRFAVLMSAMNILLLTTVGTCAVTGFLTPRWGRIVRNALLTVLLVAITLGAARLFFTVAMENPYNRDKIIANMQFMRQERQATVYQSLPPPPPPSAGRAQRSPMAQLQARRTIRVGYLPDNLPFAFFNAAGDLVEFDIEMAHILARDLGAGLAFVPIEREQMAQRLADGYCDLIMSGIAVTPERAQRMAFTQPYLSETVAFLVKDHRRHPFNSREAIKRLESPRIGVPDVPYYTDKLRRYLPQAEIVKLESVSEFLRQRGDDLDAFLYTAERGSAWSLVYPSYTVAIPQPDVLAVPLVYTIAPDNQELLDFMNVWIELKKQDRTIASLYDYWISGKNAEPKSPRRSVLRNVLHRVE